MGLMTSSDLKVKYDQAQEKVNKRLETIRKICKKLDISFDDVMVAYVEQKNKVISEKRDYMPSAYQREAIAKLGLEEKPTRLDDNTWIEANYDYNQKIDQLYDNFSKLFDVEKVANNWKVRYETELNKENAPKIQVLVDFLNTWGEHVKDYYHRNANNIVDLMNEFHNIAYSWLDDEVIERASYEQKKEIKQRFNDFFKDNHQIFNRHRFSTVDNYDYAEQKGNFDSLTKEIAKFRFIEEDKDGYNSDFGYDHCKGHYELSYFDDEKLNRIIEADKKAKYEDLCNRVTEVTGEIQDVSNLHIGAKGDLNGYVIGANGKAKVETIGAGGYNTGTIVNVKHGQIFHYRVLVHKLKD